MKIKKIIPVLLTLTMLLGTASLSFAQIKNDSILSTEANQSFLNSILEKDLAIAPLSEPTPDFVYSGTDETFYSMDVYDYGESGSQSYESSEKVSGNDMFLKTEATGGNYENEAWVYNGKEFVFSGTSRNANVVLKGDYSITMGVNQYLGGTFPGSAAASYKLVAEVYDMEDGSRVGSRDIDSNSIAGIWDTEYLSGSINEGISVYFISGHSYKVIIKAEAVAKSEIDAHAAVNGYDSPYRMKLSSVKVDF